LHENGRESLTITLQAGGPETVGKLIALFERAVGLYATLVNINAYHQPGVEAGKKAAAAVIALQHKIQHYLATHKGQTFTADHIANAIGALTEVETVFKTLQHLAANEDHAVKRITGKTIFDATYGM
jgi:glucose-6-phosphate isomerase